jgi:hypothetical protein
MVCNYLSTLIDLARGKKDYCKTHNMDVWTITRTTPIYVNVGEYAQISSSSGIVDIEVLECHHNIPSIGYGFTTITNLSKKSKPNFMAIDEEWGAFDATNLQNISIIFNYMRTWFDYVLVISHIDELKGEMDDIIEIERVNNTSKIRID